MPKSALEPLICTQCGGTVDLDENQQFGFCKYCGTQLQNSNYKVIKGEIKLDNSEFIEKFLANARRAKNKEDWEEVEKYYNLVEQNEPDNIEAIFFSSYGKCMLSLLETDIYKREQKFHVLENSISVIYDNWKIKDIDKNIEILNSITDAILSLPYTGFVYNTITYQNGYVKHDKDDTFRLFNNIFNAYIDVLERIIEKSKDSSISKENLFYLYAVLTYVISNIKVTNITNTRTKNNIKKLNDLYTKMESLNPSYRRPKKKLPSIKDPFTIMYIVTAIIVLLLFLVAII